MLDPSEIKYDDIEKVEIARGDADESYENWGWVAVIVDGEVALGQFSHCSCYGTYDEGIGSWDWTGTPDELVNLARGGDCPVLDGRKITDSDYDAEYLRECFLEIVAWDAKGRPLPKPKKK